MAKTDPLFSLIHSMSKSEKRHFKLFTSKNELQDGKDYLRLFDVIEKQAEYDEEAIIKKFRDEPYFSQLRSVKFYLYRQIIKSLKNIYDEASSGLRINNYLIEIEVLYKKGLFKNCANTIKKAKLFAEKYEHFTQLLELYVWESKVAIWINDISQLEAMKRQWMEEEQGVLKKYEEIYQLRQVTHEIHTFFLRKGYAKTEKELEFIKTQLDNPILKNEKHSFIAEVNRLSITANCLLTLGRAGERYEMLRKMMDLCDRHPHQIEERPNEHFFNLRVLANLALELQQFIYAGQLMSRMNAIYTKQFNRLDFTNKLGHLNIQTGLLLRQGKYSEALQVIQEIDKLIETRRQKLDATEDMYIQELKMMVYFCNGNYKQAQRYILEIINAGADLRLDMQTSARIAYLIIQYEEKEYQHLDYIWRSTYRYLMKKERLQQAETIVLNFLRRAKSLNSEKQILAALADFKEQIAPCMGQFMVEFPLIEWIDTKIKNRALVDIVKENYAKAIAIEQPAAS